MIGKNCTFGVQGHTDPLKQALCSRPCKPHRRSDDVVVQELYFWKKVVGSASKPSPNLRAKDFVAFVDTTSSACNRPMAIPNSVVDVHF